MYSLLYWFSLVASLSLSSSLSLFIVVSYSVINQSVYYSLDINCRYQFINSISQSHFRLKTCVNLTSHLIVILTSSIHLSNATKCSMHMQMLYMIDLQNENKRVCETSLCRHMRD